MINLIDVIDQGVKRTGRANNYDIIVSKEVTGSGAPPDSIQTL